MAAGFTISRTKRDATAGGGDQDVLGHLVACLLNEIESAAMHGNQNIRLELFDLGHDIVR